MVNRSLSGSQLKNIFSLKQWPRTVGQTHTHTHDKEVFCCECQKFRVIRYHNSGRESWLVGQNVTFAINGYVHWIWAHLINKWYVFIVVKNRSSVAMNHSHFVYSAFQWVRSFPLWLLCWWALHNTQTTNVYRFIECVHFFFHVISLKSTLYLAISHLPEMTENDTSRNAICAIRDAWPDYIK